MPQMAPLSWLSLFLYFTLIFLLTNPLNFFLFKYKTESGKKETFKKTTNWKW